MKALFSLTFLAFSIVAFAQFEATAEIDACATRSIKNAVSSPGPEGSVWNSGGGMALIVTSENDEFNAKKLESSIKLKYAGIGMAIAGLVAGANEPEAGAILSIAGAVVSVYGVIRQDIQLVRLARENSKDSDQEFRSRSQRKSERSFQSRSQQKFERDN